MTDKPNPEDTTNLEMGLGIAAGMAIVWTLLLLGLSIVLPVFAPSAEYTLGQFAVISTMLTVEIAVISVVGFLWMRRIPPARSVVLSEKNEDKALSPVIADFRIRANMYRTAAAVLFTLLVAVTIAGFFLITTPMDERADYHEALPGQLPALLEPLTATLERIETLTDPEIESLLTTILSRSTYPGWRDAIGAVALWFVLVQAIASLFRYMVRLASFYDSRADGLQISGADDKKLQKFLAILDPGPASHEGWLRHLLRRPTTTPSATGT